MKMKTPYFKTLTVISLLGILGLCGLASFGEGTWLTILADDFDHCLIKGSIIEAQCGQFLLENPDQIISLEVGSNHDGYIVFNDYGIFNGDGNAFVGCPIEPFVEDKLFVDFDLISAQTDSCLRCTLSDEDDLDVLFCSMGNTGTWQLNGYDTLIPYASGVEYRVSITLEVDRVGFGPASYTVYCSENGGLPFLLGAGVLPDFPYGRSIKEIRFEKPAGSVEGIFVIDDINLEFVIYPEDYNNTNAQGS